MGQTQLLSERRPRRPTGRRSLRLAGVRRRSPRPAGARRRSLRLAGAHRLRVLAALAAVVVAVLGGGWLWLRDSSLVAVRSVTIMGVSGRDAAQISAALQRAARRMTTLDLQISSLRRAVAAYREVRSLQVSTSFPHGLRIFVVEQIPVAVLRYPGGRVTVDADGQLLQRPVAGALPSITLAAPPAGNRLRVGDGLEQVRLLAAAPWQLIPRIARVRFQAVHGLVAQLRRGPLVYFGGDRNLAAKWAALVAVLADPGSAGAAYIDVRDPSRPAAGGEAGASRAGGGAVASTAAGTPGAGSTTTGQPSAPASTTAGQTAAQASTTAGQTTAQAPTTAGQATAPASTTAGQTTPSATTAGQG